MSSTFLTTITVGTPDPDTLDPEADSPSLSSLAQVIDDLVPVTRMLADVSGAGIAYWVGHLDAPEALSITCRADYPAFSRIDWEAIAIELDKRVAGAWLRVETEEHRVLDPAVHTTSSEWIGGKQWLDGAGQRAGDTGDAAAASYALARALQSITPRERETILGTLIRGADSLLEVHRATGIDLSQWQPVLDLVTLVYTGLVVEGTGETGEHVKHAEHETGRYALDGAL